MIALKPITPKEYSTIVQWNEGKNQEYLFQWAGFTLYQFPLTADQIAQRAETEGVQIFIIYTSGQPVGAMELCDIDTVTKSGRICRVIFAEQAKNRGYGELALRQLIHMAFTEMGLVSLSLRVACFNVAAIRCYEKAGFRVKEYFQENNPHWNHYIMELKK